MEKEPVTLNASGFLKALIAPGGLLRINMSIHNFTRKVLVGESQHDRNNFRDNSS